MNKPTKNICELFGLDYLGETAPAATSAPPPVRATSPAAAPAGEDILTPRQTNQMVRVLEALEKRVPAKLVRFFAILLGGLLGLVFPMCECGIVPVMETVMVKALEAVCAAASSTWMVAVNWPAVVGVPDMAPLAPRVRPGGSWPPATDQV